MNIGTVRKINAMLCSVAILFFMIHAILGTIMSVRAFDAKPEFLVWAGVALLVMIALMVALVAHVLINLNGMFVDLGMGGPEKAESLKRHSMYMAGLVCIVFVVLAGILVFVAM